ncbi:mitochondrial ribonuclease P catalytic subunit-like [Physella acuta]|uniref:mitochondrial ribonuclease P catalytic subunit-like n=1 Tax=Physella acuta TaxID=109671 RepID=UPI0027DBA520|nr:mitochondrial ribonuclease P catalytic subunit-like [Physella acuta]
MISFRQVQILSMSKCKDVGTYLLNKKCLDRFSKNYSTFIKHRPYLFAKVFEVISSTPKTNIRFLNFQPNDSSFRSDNKSIKTIKKKNLVAKRRDHSTNLKLFNELLYQKESSTLSNDDWLQIKETFSVTLNEKWESFCMHALYNRKNCAQAKSLINFLESQKESPNKITLTYFTSLLGQTSDNSETQDTEFKKYFDLLLSKSDNLDAASIEVLVKGLSNTRYYMECIPLLKLVQEFSEVTSKIINDILVGALKFQDHKILAQMLTLAETGKTLPNELLPSLPNMVNRCLQKNNQQGLQTLMDFVEKHGLLLPKLVLYEIHSMFESHQPDEWTGQFGYINHRSGKCTICNHKMDRLEIQQKEFNSLQTAFLDQVIVGKNIFYKTSPEEVDKYKQFIKKLAPFDVVIDGMNVIFHGQPNREKLEKTVEYFTEQEKKVLVLGSNALYKFTHNVRKMKNCHTYLTSTTKADDVFFLYAALQSRLDTLIVSRDKLRDHRFKFDPILRPIFSKWLLITQISDWFYSANGQFVIGKRHLFSLGPAKDEGGWHLPEDDTDMLNPNGKFSILCLRQRLSKKLKSN